MSVAPVDINSLKPEDVVVTSTPQNRNIQPKETPKEEEKPKAGEEPKAGEQPKAGEKPKEEEKPKAGEQPKPGEQPKIEEPKAGEEEEEEEEEEEPIEEPIEEFDWNALSDEVGIELENDDDVVESLKELASYKNLSPALLKAIEIEKNNGDVASYFKAIATDPKDLSDRDALWEQYVADNPKRVSGNPKFARMDFDRKLDKEYSLLTEYEKLSAQEKEEFFEEHKDEIEYLKEKRKFDAESARASLQEKRDGATFIPPKTGQMDEKRAEEIMKAHESGYKAALKDFDVVSIDVGNDFEFNVGLSESNKKVATEWMKNPELFLKELGFTKDKIDYDTLAGWAALISDIKYGTFGERFRQALIDNKDIQTLEQTLDAPGIVKTGGEKPIIQGDEWDAVGAAFEKKRLESKKR